MSKPFVEFVDNGSGYHKYSYDGQLSEVYEYLHECRWVYWGLNGRKVIGSANNLDEDCEKCLLLMGV